MGRETKHIEQRSDGKGNYTGSTQKNEEKVASPVTHNSLHILSYVLQQSSCPTHTLRTPNCSLPKVVVSGEQRVL